MVTCCCLDGFSVTNKHLKHKYVTYEGKESLNPPWIMPDLWSWPPTCSRNRNLQVCLFCVCCRLLRETWILRWACWRTWGGNVSSRARFRALKFWRRFWTPARTDELMLKWPLTFSWPLEHLSPDWLRMMHQLTSSTPLLSSPVLSSHLQWHQTS